MAKEINIEKELVITDEKGEIIITGQNGSGEE